MTIFNSIGKLAFPKNPMYQVGKKLRHVGAKFLFAANAIGDQYILAGPLTIDDRIARILAPNGVPTLVSATSNNLGFYYMNAAGTLVPVKSGGGNELWSAVTLVGAIATGVDLLTTKNAALDNTKAIRDLLLLGPDAEPVGGIFLVLTTTVAITVGGTFDLDIEIEESTTR